MDSHIRFIVASLVAASVAYLFAAIDSTGTLDLVAAGVFLALFVVFLLGFERFMQWSERFEAAETPTAQPR